MMYTSVLRKKIDEEADEADPYCAGCHGYVMRRNHETIFFEIKIDSDVFLFYGTGDLSLPCSPFSEREMKSLTSAQMHLRERVQESADEIELGRRGIRN